MGGRWLRSVAACVVAAASTAGCSGSEARPNVVLVTVDTLRPDFLGVYGFEGASSPNLDAFARSSVVFDRAIAASSRTAPSHASLFTSRWVRDHSIGFRNGGTRLTDEPTLAERFADAGWETAAFIGNSMLRRRVGLDRGFAVFDDELPDGESNRAVFERVADKTTARAADWLAGERVAPFFLWVQYNDPHGPYTPPAEFLGASPGADPAGDATLPALDIQRGIGGIPAYQVIGDERRVSQYRDRYAGEVRYFDAALGELLRAVEVASAGRPSIVVVTADHGESFGEDGIYCSHGYATTPNLVHIPLLVRAPGVRPRRVNVPVHQVDVMPTLLDWAGLTPPEGMAGVSLVPLLEREQPLPERNLYADVGTEVSVFRGDRYLRFRFKGELAGARAGTPVALAWNADGTWSPREPERDLVEAVVEYSAERAPMHEAPALESDDRERLRALGYLR